MREIRFSYTLTEGDLLESRTHVKIPGANEASLRNLLLLVVLVAMLYATPAIWDVFDPPKAPASLPRQLVLGIAPWFFVIAWIKLITRLSRKEQARHVWKISPLYRLELTACLHDEGVSIESASSSSRHAWNCFIGYGESPNLLLLIMSGGPYLMLPKRALPADADLSLLREEIGKRINALCLPPGEVPNHPEPSEPTLLPRLHFTLTMGDFARARRADPWRKWRGAGQDALILVPVYAGLFWLGISSRFLDSHSSLWFWGTFFVVTLVVLLITQQWHWRHAPHLHGPQVVDVTETGILVRNSTGTQWIGWGAMTGHRRKDKLFVLSLRDKTFRCIPDRAFPTKKDEEEFERQLQSRVMATPGFAVVVDPTKA